MFASPKIAAALQAKRKKMPPHLAHAAGSVTTDLSAANGESVPMDDKDPPERGTAKATTNGQSPKKTPPMLATMLKHAAGIQGGITTQDSAGEEGDPMNAVRAEPDVAGHDPANNDEPPHVKAIAHLNRGMRSTSLKSAKLHMKLAAFHFGKGGNAP